MKKRDLLLIPILLLLCVIWGNSLLPGDVSGEISGGLLERLLALFPPLGGMTEHLLRKLGHFSEFAALGFFVSWFCVTLEQRKLLCAERALFFGMLTANVDEGIQAFVPGRDANVMDVWIDTSGVLVGIAVLMLCCWIVNLRKKRKGNGK